MQIRKEFKAKQPEAPTLENPTMVGQKQRHHLSIQYPSLSQELIIPRKRLEQQENKRDPALNPPQQYSTTMKTLDVSSIKTF